MGKTAPKMNPDLQVPFDGAKHLVHWVAPWAKDTSWRTNWRTFYTLKFTGFSRGRSSVIANFETHEMTNGDFVAHVHMSLMDFERVVPRLDKGEWDGYAFYKKVGDSYFLCPE